MEEVRQSDVDYERFGVQRKTGKEISRPIYQSIYH